MSNGNLPVYARQNLFPYNENLTDSEFEELLYSIFTQHVVAGLKPYKDIYDKAHLMPGVGEEGRDVVLSKKSNNVGLIQCKKFKTSLSKPICAKEIIKFALNAICNPKLISNKNKYQYYFATSTGFSKPAVDMIATFNISIINEPDLKKWTESIINKYAEFKNLSYSSIQTELFNILKNITVTKIIPTDLNGWLKAYSAIAKQFFPQMILLESTNKSSDNAQLFKQNLEFLNKAETLWINFQYRQASDLVESVEIGIENSALGLKDQNLLKAKIFYLKSYIQADSGNLNQFNENIIKAYNLHKEKKQYRERAIKAYYDNNKLDRSLEIANSLLDEDEYNPRAWTIVHQLDPNVTVPEIVQSSQEYKMGQLSFIRSSSNTLTISNIYHLFIQEIEEHPLPLILDRSNFFYWNLVAQAAMYDVFKEGVPISLAKNNILIDKKQLNYAFELFSKLIERVYGTDFQEIETIKLAKLNYFFCLYFLNSEPSKDRLIAEELYRSFVGSATNLIHRLPQADPLISTMPQQTVEILAILLQQQLNQHVIDIADQLQDYVNPDILVLQAVAYTRLDKKDLATSAYLKYISILDYIDQQAMFDCCGVLQSLHDTGYDIKEKQVLVLFEKVFEKEYVKKLLISYYWCIINYDSLYIKEAADYVKNYWLELDETSRQVLAKIYTILKDWENAKVLWYELIKNKNEESDDLIAYLFVLFESRSNIEELAERLMYWRKNYSPNLMLALRESAIYRTIRAYRKLVTVSLYGMSHFPESPIFWVDCIRALHRLDRESDLIPLLDERILAFDLLPDIRLSVAHIYIVRGKEKLGLEACYQVVKSNWSNPKIKTTYLSIFSNYKSIANKPNPQIAKEGMVVRIQGPEKRQLVELSPEAVRDDSFVKRIVGLTIKDNFEYTKNLTGENSTYFINDIYDKYQGIAALITEEIFEKPYNGLNVQGFQLPSTDDGKVILAEIQKVIDPENTRRKIINDDYLAKFSNREIGLIELTLNVFRGELIATWQFVTSDYSDGFPIFSVNNFKRKQPYISLLDNYEYVLDSSSLLTLYYISTTNNINFLLNPFVISQHLYDYVSTELEQLMNEHSERLSINATLERVFTIVHPEDMYAKQLAYLQSLHAWMSENCRPDYAWERISWESERTENLFSEDNLLVSTLFDSLLLANKPNRVLVTDDLFVSNNIPTGSLKWITTEYFFQNNTITDYNTIWPLLIKLNMRGLSLTGQQLYKTFTENKLSTNINNDFYKAIKSLRFKDNPNPNNLKHSIIFLKMLYIEDLSLDYKKSITRYLFNILVEDNRNLTREVIDTVFLLIDSSFTLLGNLGDIIKEELIQSLRNFGHKL